MDTVIVGVQRHIGGCHMRWIATITKYYFCNLDLLMLCDVCIFQQTLRSSLWGIIMQSNSVSTYLHRCGATNETHLTWHEQKWRQLARSFQRNVCKRLAVDCGITAMQQLLLSMNSKFTHWTWNFNYSAIAFAMASIKNKIRKFTYTEMSCREFLDVFSK